MSDLAHPDDEPRRDDALQFDQAEYRPKDEDGTADPDPPLACGICQRPIADVYYEINGRITCDECRTKVEASLKGGSKISRVVRAFVFGAGAAIAGFAIYFAIMKFANLEIGLISILVGFMVGASVRKGSDHRGGWFYQLMAIFLTYTAIAASYSAAILPQMFAELERQQANEAPAAADNPAGAGEAADANPAPEPLPFKDNPLLGLLIALAMLVGFAYALPVLVGFQQPIGLLIVAFAIWQAWKMNTRVKVAFNGPFRVGGGDDDPLASRVHYA